MLSSLLRISHVLHMGTSTATEASNVQCDFDMLFTPLLHWYLVSRTWILLKGFHLMRFFLNGQYGFRSINFDLTSFNVMVVFSLIQFHRIMESRSNTWARLFIKENEKNSFVTIKSSIGCISRSEQIKFGYNELQTFCAFLKPPKIITKLNTKYRMLKIRETGILI